MILRGKELDGTRLIKELTCTNNTTVKTWKGVGVGRNESMGGSEGE